MPSNSERVVSITRIAGADLTTKQNRFCKVQSDSRVILAGNGDRALGVLQGKADTDRAVEVAVGGRVLVVLGASVTAGASVQSDANGAAITQTSTGVVLGQFLESGSAGENVSMNWAPQGAP